MHRAVALSLAAVALLGACAPSQRRLLAARHYPEALAGVDEGALDGGAVLGAIARDLEVGVHMQAVTADMLREQLPGAPAGFADLALVRVIHDSHAIPLPDYQVSFGLLAGAQPLPPVDTSIAALARRAGEALPEPEVVQHEGTTDVRLVVRTRRPLLEVFARVLVNVATVGLVHPIIPIVRNEGRPAYTEVRPLTPEDYARVSPAAESLLRWITPTSCTGLGERCERRLLWARDVSAPLTLLVVVHVGGYRDPALIYRIPLPPAGLDEGLHTIFGKRVRRVDELTRAAGLRPQVSYLLPDPRFGADNTMTPESRGRLCREIQGTRRRPGLLERAELRFTLELGRNEPDGEKRALQLRLALLACGISPAHIELAEPDGELGLALRVRHAVDP